MEEKDLKEKEDELRNIMPDSETEEPEEKAVLQQRDYRQELVKIIRGNVSPRLMRDEVESYHENDIAAALELLTKAERVRLYRVLDASVLADIFSYVDEDKVSVYFSELTIKKRVDIVAALDADDAVTLLRHLDKNARTELIDLIDNESKRDIAMISSFDEDEIGSRMSTNYIHIKTGISVRQAMRELVEQAAENDNISTLYVIDDDKTFYGAIDLKDLITARESDNLEERITTSYPYVYGRELIEDCIERLKEYSEDSIPVLDNDNKLLGVITAQDIVEVVDDEMGEDYAKLAGLAAEEDLNEPIKASMQKRLPWLLILLGLGMLVSSVVGLFEGVVAELTIVISFQSLILDMAGNVGTQSLAVTIRVLTDENLSAKQKLGLIWKEGRIGFLNGLLLGSLAFALIGLYIAIFKGYDFGFAYSISACIGVALLLAMLVSSISGTVIPIFFKKIKVDPAVASGPLITTLNDLVAVVSYYGLVWLFLIQMMHLSS